MAIFIDKQTRIIVQGFTGKIGTFHAQDMINYGSNVVGGITPGKGGQKHLDRPVFNTVKESVEQAGAEASIIFVPPAYAADSIMEAAEAGIKYCVAITDGIPTQDMMKVKIFLSRFPKQQRMVLTGPNCAGTISPGKSMLGIMPGHIYMPGNVGIVGRSGTLGYEVEAGIFAKEHMSKPVVAYIAGLTAPKGRRMGHAGAIISSSGESAAEKVERLQELGVTIAPTPAAMGETVAKVLAKL
jgi:malate-CoA ligase subunit alpha